jgi:hypothetical protein
MVHISDMSGISGAGPPGGAGLVIKWAVDNFVRPHPSSPSRSAAYSGAGRPATARVHESPEWLENARTLCARVQSVVSDFAPHITLGDRSSQTQSQWQTWLERKVPTAHRAQLATAELEHAAITDQSRDVAAKLGNSLEAMTAAAEALITSQLTPYGHPSRALNP